MVITFENGGYDVRDDDSNIYDFFDQRGFKFPREVIARYVLSLMTKPFVILTGISGTGKTKIAQIFSDFILQDETLSAKDDRKRFIPVRPDWMDNRGLLGFFNLLDEKYHATPLLNLLMAARREGEEAKPYFIILDEMNLARVEQYFSDFLSIMESRTPDSPHGEHISLHEFKQDRAAVGGFMVPPCITIPPNVFITGTVNVDESTYMFSPKVLDRANVIEFNDVYLKDDADPTRSDSFVLRSDKQDVQEITRSLAAFRLPSTKDFEEAKLSEGNRAYESSLLGLHGLLRRYNVHFGYRVINEMSRFLLNAEHCVEDYRFDDAFDIQVLQKILPKYHGTQAKLKEPLENFLAFCFRQPGNYTEDLLKRGLDWDDSARFPRSAQKIARMLNLLNVQGYCSFIE